MSEEQEPPYLINYTHKGEDYGFTIWAESWEDAELRLRAIASNGEVIGSNVSDLPTRRFGRDAVRPVENPNGRT